jgi:ABC-2 type transport system ATP-binding protein
VNAIEIRGLVKRFRGTAALDGIDLDVPAGQVFGFLGPNGAGKTTTLRILTGLARPTAGSARILGQDVTRTPHAVRAQIGFLPDVPGFYPWMTAREFITFAGRLFALERDVLAERTENLLAMAGLSPVRTPIGGFSRGMKQRLGIAQALVNAPRLLLLDEPTSALDPIGRREVLDMIASLRGRTTVFFSTHILADVERVCDNVAILDRGQLVASATIPELKRRVGAERITVEVDGEVVPLVQALHGRPWLTALERDGPVIKLTVSDLASARREVPAALAAAGLGLKRLQADEISLEEVFVELVGRGPA